jgi:chromosome segregation ATPase
MKRREQMNSDRLKKIEAEIAKTREKLSTYTARLRELERQKTECENAGIIALVRDMDILPDELAAFIQAFKQKSSGDGETAPPLPDVPADTIKNDLEDKDE